MRRIPFFPIPIPGETIHSVLARYLARNASPTSHKLNSIGQPRYGGCSVLPPQLRTITESVPLGHPWYNDAKNVIDNNSSVPFFLFFASLDRRQALVKLLYSGTVINPSSLLALTMRPELKIAKWPRFCPECINNSVEEFGFPVYYREHQISATILCSLHNISLKSECSVCREAPSYLTSRSLAGQCLCSQPQFQDVSEGISHFHTSDFWLSEQIKIMHCSEHMKIRSDLLQSLRNKLLDSGYGLKSGFDLEKLYLAIDDHFKHSRMLKLLGLSSGSTVKHLSRISRALHHSEKLPNALICLVLSRLVVDNVLDLVESKIVPRAPRNLEPSGYGRRRKSTTVELDLKAVRDAIASSKGKITVAAMSLNVSPSVFAREVRRHQLVFPIPRATELRLGNDVIRKVQSELRDGVQKTKICAENKISEWSLELIELSDLSLRDSHQIAVVNAQRIKHRNCIDQYLKSSPNAGRSEVTLACPGAADWVRTYDREWFFEKFPAKKSFSNSGMRKPRRAWDLMDLKWYKIMKEFSKKEKQNLEKPKRITKTLLFHQVGVNLTRLTEAKLPKSSALANEESETTYEFRVRRIEWAMKQYRSLNVSLSVNLLRRVAGLPGESLSQYAELICKLAKKYHIPIDDRSRFFS